MIFLSSSDIFEYFTKFSHCMTMIFTFIYLLLNHSILFSLGYFCNSKKSFFFSPVLSQSKSLIKICGIFMFTITSTIGPNNDPKKQFLFYPNYDHFLHHKAHNLRKCWQKYNLFFNLDDDDLFRLPWHVYNAHWTKIKHCAKLLDNA